MPPAASSSSRRRTRDQLEDDNSDTDNTVSSQSSDHKRPRLASRGHGATAATTNGDRRGEANGTVTGGVTVDDFSPGAILRVSVENFVTYEKAEFFPGPNLNMVIGPNGTGKSSLVCAICLGLGYGPKHLGRAGAIKEFVKHGKEIATIEIELRKRPTDRSNFIIKVQIRRETNSQKWWLNGKESSQKAVQNLMRQLKIQVDNLCQFLPQDRVVEFAQCTPVDLLHETLRAAAPEEMLQWQSQLQELHKDKKEVGAAVHSDADALRNLENRQQGLQADVDRIREREEIQSKVELLRKAHLMCRYQDARQQYVESKTRRVAAKQRLRRFERDSGPSLQAVNQKQEYAKRVGALIPLQRRAVKEAERASQNLAARVNTASDLVKEFQSKIDAERKGFETKKKDLQTARQKITSLQADIKQQPPEFNSADWNQKIRAQEHNQRELATDLRKVEAQIREFRDRGASKNEEMKKVQEDLDSFDTQQGQQLSFMKRHFPELAKGWEWIQENQDSFEKEVFGPPMISCSIKDERYSDQVQALLQSDDFTCFTAQTKNDYKKLSDQLYRQMSLSVVIRTCANPMDSYKSPVSHEQARRLGLDGFAIDYLSGPEPVLAMLCSEKGLHRSGVSLEEHNDAQYESLVQSGSVTQWAAGRHSYIVRRRREYGPQAISTVTKNIQAGKFWTSQPVDTQEKVELSRRMNELKDEFATLKAEHKRLKEQSAEINHESNELDTKIEELKQEKSDLQREYSKWRQLPDKIESEERKRAECEEAMRNIRKALSDLQYEWDDAAIARAEVVLEHAESLNKIQEAHNVLLETRVWHIEAESDIDGLKRRNASIMARLEEEKRLLEEETKVAQGYKDIATTLHAEVEQLMASVSDALQREITEACDGKSAEEVQMEMDAEEAKLELIHTANPNVIREFEHRASEIDRLKKKMEGSQEKLASLAQSIEELMAKWEPKLDALVSQINDAFAYNFEQISCAGEVRVHKDDDFDNWAMDIMVKFRENEELQQLNAHRQSGGERAVSTIFYLMALQSMAQSPFRVVDEINQGMDPRNERMVHERTVEIACREHTSQYFLITPKLLTGLRYDPKMRVLCIASGEHMPREGRKLDFKRCLKIQKGLLAGA